MSLHTAKPEHEVTYQELLAMVNQKAGKLDAIEILAVAANMIGKLVAMQDQRRWSPGQVMEVVALNIEHGNKQVLDELSQSKGKA